MGTDTNFFGQSNIEQNALSMKSSSDAILIRNTILENLEKALLQPSPKEMKKYIFPKDYPEIDLSKMRIVLFESSQLLSAMSSTAFGLSEKYLEKMGVEVKTGIWVTDYDGTTATLSDGSTFETKTLIWAAGVKANLLEGFRAESFGRGGRLLVNRENGLIGYEHIFAIGDIAQMETPKYPGGHPQVAQVAIQQAKLLSANFKRIAAGKEPLPFEYTDKGSLATIGRNRAVADLPGFKLRGFIAWVLWSFVHLFTIMGVKNRLLIFLNWTWNYFTYDQSLRLLIKPKQKFQQNQTGFSSEITNKKQLLATKIPDGQDLIRKLTPN